MTPQEFHTVLKAALQAEQTAFCRLFEAFAPAVFATVQRLAGNVAVAEELTQDVFLKAFENLSNYDETRASFNTWLQRIAFNTAVSYLRRTSFPNTVSLNENVGFVDTLSDAAMQDFFDSDEESIVEGLMRAVETLPPEEKLLLILYYYENRTLQEISCIMQVSAPALSGRLKRIRSKIYAKLTT